METDKFFIVSHIYLLGAILTKSNLSNYDFWLMIVLAGFYLYLNYKEKNIDKPLNMYGDKE